MRDVVGAGGGNGGEPEIRMTLLAINGGYWLYEGEDLMDDVLYMNGAYPFRIRLAHFKDTSEFFRFVGEEIAITALWRFHPGIIDRLRRENLLIEVFPADE